jgi:Uma2 family endonuclease
VHYGYAEYLAFEEGSPNKHEYLDGEIYAMAGVTPDHAALAAAVLRIIGQQLPHGCRARAFDRPVDVSGRHRHLRQIAARRRRSHRHHQPDDPGRSQQQLDRGILVSHKAPRITLHRRTDEGWRSMEAGAGESLELESIGGAIAVDDVYRDGLEDTGS